MATAKIHLMDVNLNLSDMPLGYTPPVGPPVRLSVRYNARDIFQPANFNYVNFGPQWTCDWIAYLTDTPSNRLADVNEYLPGGGQRTFTGFDTNTQTFAFQQYDRTLLKRTEHEQLRTAFRRRLEVDLRSARRLHRQHAECLHDADRGPAGERRDPDL